MRQFPRRIEIVSPGGFLPGITPENFLWKQAPRNRRLAEAFSKCGLVERAGQGVNRMFEESIKEGKLRPDLSGTDDYEVRVTLHGEVQDARFLRFLEQIGRERPGTFTTENLLVLDLVHHEQPVPEPLWPRLAVLVEQGAVERIGRGRGTRYTLSRRFYAFLGERGTYTRKRGLDRPTNRALLLKHIEDNQQDGSQLRELMQVLPAMSRDQVQSLLRELKSAGQVHPMGQTKASRWYPGPAPAGIASEPDEPPAKGRS